uniref:Uncharacterized protein n=1 Tax=Arundo donax TaxID=35708 RepID=A0A0A9FJL9_ARUDO
MCWYIKQHVVPCIKQFKGYAREAVTICSFSSNMARACE